MPLLLALPGLTNAHHGPLNNHEKPLLALRFNFPGYPIYFPAWCRFDAFCVKMRNFPLGERGVIGGIAAKTTVADAPGSLGDAGCSVFANLASLANYFHSDHTSKARFQLTS
jgi:hypothetical protein